MSLTEYHDLRGGEAPWDDGPVAPGDPVPAERVDVAIVGAGVMGAMLAERLSTADRRVALVDRRPPAHGSTAASTALVMWEMDVPLIHLAGSIGEAEAVRRWRRVHDAVVRLAERIDRLGIDADKAERPIVYLAGALLDAAGMAEEVALRQRHGLPSVFLDGAAIAERFGIAPRAGAVSGDSYAVDPARLTHDLLRRAREQGATVSYPVDVLGLAAEGAGVRLDLDGGGTLRAGQVILAGGYERARLFLPAAFEILSSYAIATAPGTAPLWNEQAMIWEASDPYLYCRTDGAGRVIAGGEDEDFHDAARRDPLIEAKAGTIAAKLESLVGGKRVIPTHRWAATFGASPDGLPAIGRAANHKRLWLASGFGGNGVSFAALAAELIGAALDGAPDRDAVCFDPYRFSDRP